MKNPHRHMGPLIMTTWEIPPPAYDSVYDKHGDEWNLTLEKSGVDKLDAYHSSLWTRTDRSETIEWCYLLVDYGPVTNVPPIQDGTVRWHVSENKFIVRAWNKWWRFNLDVDPTYSGPSCTVSDEDADNWYTRFSFSF